MKAPTWQSFCIPGVTDTRLNRGRMGNGRAGGAIMQTAAQTDWICAARLKIINHLVSAPNGSVRVLTDLPYHLA